MENKQVTIDTLTPDVANYLRKMAYSDSRIAQYYSVWNKVSGFMKNNDIQYYSASAGDDFIYSLMGDRTYNQLNQWEKDHIQCTNILTEFLENGSIKFTRGRKFSNLRGPIAKTVLDYIAHRKSFVISKGTEEEYKHRFQLFLSYLSENGIEDVSLISRQVILNYSKQLVFSTPYVRHRTLSILKNYFRFLYDQNCTEADLSQMVPKDRYVKQPQLPSTYAKSEVEQMIASIDRSNPKGKRDYTMVLITARLGLRASDVCELSFKNLRWEQNLIVLDQKKTGKRIELPLLQEIGEAIIDYLKYGRPVSELPYIFLHMVFPYDRLSSPTLHSIVTMYLRKAGIKYEGERKHGPHALRHSLAGILLEKHIPIPVISEVLGHTNTESTRYYLRIDMNSLRQCALDVSSVPNSFYQRRQWYE